MASPSFDELNTKSQRMALDITMQTLSMPLDIAFHRSMDHSLAQTSDAFSVHVMSLMNNLLSLASTIDGTNLTKGKGKTKLDNKDDLLDKFHSVVVDSMDHLLERADVCLDEYLGTKKPLAMAVNPPKQSPQKKTVPRLDAALQHASRLRKPQLDFKIKVDNFSTLPWKPLLPHKYNAQIPLGYVFDEGELLADWPHPYFYEIKHIQYPLRMFQSVPPVPFKPFEETPFNFVSSPDGFASMLQKLRISEELAIDLEHHDYRSYTGFLCLMQISTRDEDWIVDLLALREGLGELNEVLTNPAVVKVLHGADSDIVWLQRDFSLYIVNLFDTYHASKVLELPRHGLANLLETYCDFTTDKRYQLADWRIRPLPSEMIRYARADTHFLLYIYDNLRNALLERAWTHSPSTGFPNAAELPPGRDPTHAYVYEVLRRSEETALRVYEKETYDPEGSGPGGWNNMAKKWNKPLLTKAAGAEGGVKREVYKAVHAWRDRVAREDDESTRFVLPNHHLFQLVEKLPSNMGQLFKLFKNVPPIVRRRAKELLDVVLDAIRKYNNAGAKNSSAVLPAKSNKISADVLASEGSLKVALGSQPNSSYIGPIDAKAPALFGASIVPVAASTFEVAQSSLFGSTLGTTPDSQNRDFVTSSRFQEVLSRIHSSLVIAPIAPKRMPFNTSTKEHTHPTSDEAAVTGSPELPLNATLPPESGLIEIPYIPPHQRQTMECVQDSVVVVGQPRQQKRKRMKSAPASSVIAKGSQPAESATNTKKYKTTSEDVEQGAFEFSTVPNILDGSPGQDLDSTTNHNVTAKTGGLMSYEHGSSRPLPTAYLKDGNLSKTFK